MDEGTAPLSRARGGLVQREPHLAALDGLRRAAVGGEGRGVLLLGEAGVGKTSLLQAGGADAIAQGMEVLRATGDPLESDLPWSLVLQLLTPLVRSRHADLLTVGAAVHVKALLDGLGTAIGAQPLPLLHGLHWLLEDLGERQPVLLLIDDLHWADHASLRAICYLLRRLEGIPVAVAMAARDGEPGDVDTRSLLATVAANPDVDVQTVRPLAPAVIDQLVLEELPGASPSFRRAVTEAVAGNPFLCHEVIRAVRADGLAPDDDAAARLQQLRPAGVRHRLLVRLAHLGAEASGLATAIAVLGPSASLPRARRVAGLTADRGREALGTLVTAALVRAEPDLTFVHPIVREAVIADLGDARERALHGAAARVLADGGARDEEIASHLLRADPIEEGWAVGALRTAAAADLARGAPERAVQLLRAALTPLHGTSVRREVLRELADAEVIAGDPSAIAHYEEAVELGTGVGGPVLLRRLGDARYAAGRYTEAVESYAQGLAAVRGDDDEVEEALLLAGLDSASRHGQQTDHPLRGRVRELMADPRPSGLADRVLLAASAGRHALAGDLPHDHVVQLARAALAGAVPEALGRVLLEPVIAALMIGDDLDGALGVLGAVMDRATERGEVMAYAGLLPLRAVCLLRRGLLAEAAADAADAIRLAEDTPGAPRQALAPAHRVVALTALARGDLAAARSAIDVPDHDARWAATPFHGWFLDAAGQVMLADGDAEGALVRFHQAGAAFTRGGGSGTFCDWRGGAARALQALGRHDEAGATAEEALALARAFGAPSALGAALRTCARVSTDHERAATLLTEADTLLCHAQARLEAARVAVALGAAVRRAGRRRQAREALRRGLDEARRCGAIALVAAATEELAATGASRPNMSVTGPGALTPSEQRVARLAAEGRTNREIAETLFVTRKTIELHLSSVYRKLGIAGREGLTEALAQQDV